MRPLVPHKNLKRVSRGFDGLDGVSAVAPSAPRAAAPTQPRKITSKKAPPPPVPTKAGRRASSVASRKSLPPKAPKAPPVTAAALDDVAAPAPPTAPLSVVEEKKKPVRRASWVKQPGVAQVPLEKPPRPSAASKRASKDKSARRASWVKPPPSAETTGDDSADSSATDGSTSTSAAQRRRRAKKKKKRSSLMPRASDASESESSAAGSSTSLGGKPRKKKKKSKKKGKKKKSKKKSKQKGGSWFLSDSESDSDFAGPPSRRSSADPPARITSGHPGHGEGTPPQFDSEDSDFGLVPPPLDSDDSDLPPPLATEPQQAHAAAAPSLPPPQAPATSTTPPLAEGTPQPAPPLAALPTPPAVGKQGAAVQLHRSRRASSPEDHADLAAPIVLGKKKKKRLSSTQRAARLAQMPRVATMDVGAPLIIATEPSKDVDRASSDKSGSAETTTKAPTTPMFDAVSTPLPLSPIAVKVAANAPVREYFIVSSPEKALQPPCSTEPGPRAKEIHTALAQLIASAHMVARDDFEVRAPRLSLPACRNTHTHTHTHTHTAHLLLPPFLPQEFGGSREAIWESSTGPHLEALERVAAEDLDASAIVDDSAELLAASAALDALIQRERRIGGPSLDTLRKTEAIAKTVREAAVAAQPIQANRAVLRLSALLSAVAPIRAVEDVDSTALRREIATDAALKARADVLRSKIAANIGGEYSNVREVAAMETELAEVMEERFEAFDRKRGVLLEARFPAGAPFAALVGENASLPSAMALDAEDSVAALEAVNHDLTVLDANVLQARFDGAKYRVTLDNDLVLQAARRRDLLTIAQEQRANAISAILVMLAAEEAAERIDLDLAAEQEARRGDFADAKRGNKWALSLAGSSRSTRSKKELQSFLAEGARQRTRLDQVAHVRTVDADIAAAANAVATQVVAPVQRVHAARLVKIDKQVATFDTDLVELHCALWSSYERSRVQLLRNAEEDAVEVAELLRKERASVLANNLRRAQRYEAQRAELEEEIGASATQAAWMATKARALDERAAPSYEALRQRGVAVEHPFFRTQEQVLESVGSHSPVQLKDALLAADSAARNEGAALDDIARLTPEARRSLAKIANPSSVNDLAACLFGDIAGEQGEIPMRDCDARALATRRACASVPHALLVALPVTRVVVNALAHNASVAAVTTAQHAAAHVQALAEEVGGATIAAARVAAAILREGLATVAGDAVAAANAASESAVGVAARAHEVTVHGANDAAVAAAHSAVASVVIAVGDRERGVVHMF